MQSKLQGSRLPDGHGDDEVGAVVSRVEAVGPEIFHMLAFPPDRIREVLMVLPPWSAAIPMRMGVPPKGFFNFLPTYPYMGSFGTPSR